MHWHVRLWILTLFASLTLVLLLLVLNGWSSSRQEDVPLIAAAILVFAFLGGLLTFRRKRRMG
jgi:hypothetical protein